MIDRVRVVSDKVEDLIRNESTIELFEERRALFFEQVNRLSVRADLLARSLTVFYIAAGVFVATSVSIGIV